MSSSDVNPKTRFASTQFPVKVRSGKAGSDAGHSAASGPACVQRLAAPPVMFFRAANWSRIDRPGASPGVSSHPSLTGTVLASLPLSCVHS